ncbi:MAG: hypothetical protein FJY37_15600, partial [Betaproteobacteria bacterium]|nr:hypothetical protein [Betaproteobacteria bacterium]
MPDFKKLATGFNAAVRAADAEASALQKMKGAITDADITKADGGRVRPQQGLTGDGSGHRPPINMPDIYADGGGVPVTANQQQMEKFRKIRERLERESRERAPHGVNVDDLLPMEGRAAFLPF